MRFHKLRDGILNKIGIKIRLRIVCLRYLISLMIETRKHSLTSASELSGLGISSFSKFLQNNNSKATPSPCKPPTVNAPVRKFLCRQKNREPACGIRGSSAFICVYPRFADYVKPQMDADGRR